METATKTGIQTSEDGSLGSTGICDPSRQGMNPRLGSWMETATKTGIEKVEDLLLKKFGMKKTEGSDGRKDRQATAVKTYIGSD